MDVQSAVTDAKCVQAQVPDGMKLSVLIALFAKVANMSIDSQELMTQAKCIAVQIPQNMQMSVLINLAAQIASNQSNGISGVTGVYGGTTAQRNATVPSANWALWILTDSTPPNQVSVWNNGSWV